MRFTVFPNDIDPFSKSGVVKFGIDPTGPDLHLGHLLPLRIVKKFKDLGFDIQIILGTFTAQTNIQLKFKYFLIFRFKTGFLFLLFLREILNELNKINQ